MQHKLVILRGIDIDASNADAEPVGSKFCALHSWITGSRNATQFMMSGDASEGVK